MPAQPAAAGSMPDTDDVVIAPRVLDQRAFNELSRTLRALIDEARAAGEQLAESSRAHQQKVSESTRSAQQLQERLHLSARMLKAMQSQADAARGSAQAMSTLDERVSTLESRLEARVQQLLDDAQTRIDETAQRAIARLDESTRAGEVLLRDVDQRLVELMPRAERLGELVESAEVNIAALSHRSALSARNAEQSARTLTSLHEQSEEKISLLRQESDRVTELRAVLERVGSLIEHWQQTVRQVEQPADPKTRPAHAAEPKPQVEAVPQLVQELRESISRDMQRLSAVVSDIACRVETLHDQRSSDGPPAEVKAPRITSRPAPRFPAVLRVLGDSGNTSG